MNTHAFFESLARRADTDTSVVATLRRSLSFDPGAFPPAFPFVEPFTRGLSERDRRTVYLAASLWASAQRRESGPPSALPSALYRVQSETGSSSIESRFVGRLDADADELVWRLRHAVALTSASGFALDWPGVLDDLLQWGAPSRHVQRRWARQFWGNPDETESGSTDNASI